MGGVTDHTSVLVPHAHKDKEQADRFNTLILSKGMCRGGKIRHSEF